MPALVMPPSSRSTAATIPSSSPAKLTLSTRNIRSNVSRNAADGHYSPSPTSPKTGSRLKTEMYYTHSSSSPLSPGHSTSSGPAKLHKRGASSTSLSGATSPKHSNPHFATPFATYEDPFPDVAPAPSLSSSVPKIKPYLRKMSAAKEDQGMIDLSKSLSDNDRLAGLGIQDFAPKTVADVNFAHSRRGQQHGRTTSVGSQVSTASGSLRPNQAFMHPMAKTPRPYTPPAGASYASSLNDDEANESDDIVEDEFRLGTGFRTRRSVSISSTPAASNPTPLSQSHTASDLGLIPKLTSTSQSNLSLASNYSDKSSKSKRNRPRRNTELSQEYIPSPSSRTSFDKAFSLKSSRKSDPNDAKSRDEQILAARRKFEEKEASKERKFEKRRQERQRRRSDAQPPLKPALKQIPSDTSGKKRRKSSAATALPGAEDEKGRPRTDSSADFRAMSYEDYRPANAASLPRYGNSPGESEKRSGGEKGPGYQYTPQPVRDDKVVDGGWMRFSTWFQTRMLSCGGSRD